MERRKSQLSESLPGETVPAEIPVVTVIITCYNLGRYLQQAVSSVKRQSMNRWRLIVVDDGSTDEETLEALKVLEGEGTELLRLDNGGVARARNQGIGLSNTPYICCLDADDALSESYLEKTVALMERDCAGKVALVTTWMESFGEENRLYKLGGKRDPAMLLTDNFFHVSSLFRRKAWEEAGGYSENLPGYQDWDLWISFVERGYSWETVEEPLFNYRVRKVSMVTHSDRIRPELVREIAGRHGDLFRKYYRESVYHRELKLQAYGEEDQSRRRLRGRLESEPWFPLIDGGEGIYVFGTGKKAEEYMKALRGSNVEILGFFDNDSRREGGVFFNRRVSPPFLQRGRVLVLSQWEREIAQQLLKMGYSEEEILLPTLQGTQGEKRE